MRCFARVLSRSSFDTGSRRAQRHRAARARHRVSGRESPDFDFSALRHRFLPHRQHAFRHGLVQVIFAAVVADHRRNLFDDDGRAVPFQRHGRGAGSGFAQLADHAMHHRLRVLKSSDHNVGAGR